MAMLKLVFDMETTELLHATIVGEDATELIHIAMMAIGDKWRIDDFRDACFSYPSLGELFKSAASNAAARLAIEIERGSTTPRETAA